MKTEVPTSIRSSEKLGHALHAAIRDFSTDLRMHEIRREIWRGLLRRVQRMRVSTR